MAFEVPPLPYDYNALEPHVDEATMRVHHDKHHQAYVDNANAALEGTPLADKPVEHVLAKAAEMHVHRIETNEADLEDVFLELYRSGT